MRVPIQYALTYPARAPAPERALDLLSLGRLDFLPPEVSRYPALALARSAAEAGGTYPTVLSSADEAAVAAFLRGAIAFQDIARIVGRVLERHVSTTGPLTLEAIAEADAWARLAADEAIAQLNR
jgi:1-deoxy-D-xylulose-5-phosphate reductoisomerase